MEQNSKLSQNLKRFSRQITNESANEVLEHF